MLDAAERRAIEVGLTKLRVGQVAADAGVSRQTVYNEFGDKFGIALITTHAGPVIDVARGRMAKAVAALIEARRTRP